mgnify:CR=1 FL=1
MRSTDAIINWLLLAKPLRQHARSNNDKLTEVGSMAIADRARVLELQRAIVDQLELHFK